MDAEIIQKICIWALPVLLAITVHEAAHAYAAKRFGDPTAFVLGRMTLNPLKHIDPVGTVILPLLGLVLGGFVFGWAKPVPVNFAQLRRPKIDMRYVAAAGPLANLAMAIVWALLFKLALFGAGSFSEPLELMSRAGMQINVVLMVLNLLPLLPLDGGRIVESLLPRAQAYQFAKLEPYGMFILIGLLITGLLGSILSPLVSLVYHLLGFLL